MNSLFSPDNPVINTLNSVVDTLVLGFLWLLCSIPIITIGASTTALCYAYNKAVCEKESYAIKAFFDSFKLNFKQATMLWIIIATIFAICVLNYCVARTMVEQIKFMNVPIIVASVIFIVVLMWAMYVFPYLARFENSTKTIMKNCVLIMIADFKWTIVLTVLFAIAALLFPLILCMSASLYIFFANKIHKKVFSKYMKDQEADYNKIIYEKERNLE